MIQIHPGETSQPQDFIACSVALQPHALKLALLTFLWEVDLEQVWGHSEDVILRENQWQQCKMLAVFSGYSFIDGRKNLVMHACISLSSFRLNSLNLNVHSCTYKRYDHFVHWDNEHCRQNICSCSSFHLNDHTLILRILLLKIYNFLVEVNINSTTGKYCAVTLPSRVSQLRTSSTQKLKLLTKY